MKLITLGEILLVLLCSAMDVAHHILVAHGQTVKKFRELGAEGQNYRTLERTKKESFYWYKQVVQNGWFDL